MVQDPLSNTDKGCKHLSRDFISASWGRTTSSAPCDDAGSKTKQLGGRVPVILQRSPGTRGHHWNWSSVQCLFIRVNLLSLKTVLLKSFLRKLQVHKEQPNSASTSLGDTVTLHIRTVSLYHILHPFTLRTTKQRNCHFLPYI